ncbi:hypothetical protein NKH85_12525 [Mesorhizobium sp. M0924]|uniref:hypothetical protein n=1 Tax=unclassified Mesorhizobium TaxID=325217 RepID=UPI0033359E0A
MVAVTSPHAAAHESNIRATLSGLLAIYEIDQPLANIKPVRSIAIFDDALTAGTHYRAIQIKLSARFPGVPTFGMFGARRVAPPPRDGWIKQIQDLLGGVDD